jgi:hypothetical protein
MSGGTGGTRSITTVAALLLATVAASCASTEMTSTWTDPSAKGASLSKIAVICLARDPGLRRMAEDTMASRLRGAQAVPSYRVLGDVDIKDKDAVKAKLQEQGFQGALVMRLGKVTEQVSAVGGPYGSFDGYYGWAATTAYDPVYLQTDTIVHVASNLYSLPDGKLIWSGVSKTFDPASAQSFMTDVSTSVAKSIEKDRLVL